MTDPGIAPSASSAADSAVAPADASRLRTYNIVMGAIHALSAIAVLALTNAFALPVTATFLDGPPGSAVPAPETLFEIRTGWAVAAFLFISAAAHWLIAFAVFPSYIDGLGRTRNYYRWIEYSLSSSIMIVLIAQLTGISDVVALLAIFGVNASMILFGLLQEHYEEPGGSMLPFWLGCFAGIIPWIGVVLYAASPGNDTATPAFVIAIIVSLFIFFNSFALNQWLQYRRVGRWSNYLFGERLYILLSLIAKSLLAWQIFAGTLVG